MDQGKATVLAAFVGAAGALITKLIEYLSENIGLNSIASQNKKAANAIWRGETRQEKGPDGTPIVVAIELRLTSSWRKIKGVATVSGGGDTLEVKVNGGFKTDSVLYFDYSSKTRLNFGKIILKLNADRNLLEGKVIGWGNKSEGIICGDMTLRSVT